jgi:hypothetical protein
MTRDMCEKAHVGVAFVTVGEQQDDRLGLSLMAWLQVLARVVKPGDWSEGYPMISVGNRFGDPGEGV